MMVLCALAHRCLSHIHADVSSPLLSAAIFSLTVPQLIFLLLLLSLNVSTLVLLKRPCVVHQSPDQQKAGRLGRAGWETPWREQPVVP